MVALSGIVQSSTAACAGCARQADEGQRDAERSRRKPRAESQDRRGVRDLPCLPRPGSPWAEEARGAGRSAGSTKLAREDLWRCWASVSRTRQPPAEDAAGRAVAGGRAPDRAGRAAAPGGRDRRGRARRAGDDLVQAFLHLARSDAHRARRGTAEPADPCAFNPQHGPAVTEVDWAAHRAAPTTYRGVPAPTRTSSRSGRSPRRFRHDQARRGRRSPSTRCAPRSRLGGAAQGDEPGRQRRQRSRPTPS